VLDEGCVSQASYGGVGVRSLCVVSKEVVRGRQSFGRVAGRGGRSFSEAVRCDTVFQEYRDNLSRLPSTRSGLHSYSQQAHQPHEELTYSDTHESQSESGYAVQVPRAGFSRWAKVKIDTSVADTVIGCIYFPDMKLGSTRASTLPSRFRHSA